ncbi:glycosyl hydrolase family 65 protein [Streptomyces sp. NPDC050504]|uniref:glycosyl hydrolase family 65 protein n=1 Tax=Streptomyces sp. NPDC050504 TaxID=3365618 RepID=UPI0037BA2AF5
MRIPRRTRRTRLALALATVAALAPTGPSTAAPPPSPAAQPSPSPWELTATSPTGSRGHSPYVANGYLGHRVPPLGAGYAESAERTGWPLYTPRYEGAFVSGLYGREAATAAGRDVLAALPTWTRLDVSVDGETPGPAARLTRYRQTLHLRTGTVTTAFRWTTADGRATDVTYEVLADRSDPHTGAVRLTLTPRWNGTAHLTGGLDWRGARRLERTGPETFRTLGTGTAGAVAQVLVPRPARDGVQVRAGDTYAFTKYVGVDTALTSRNPHTAARTAAQRAAKRGWRTMSAANAAAWRDLWRARIDVPGAPELQTWVRSAQYGLFAGSRARSANSIAPAGLTSDNYAGMVFWDAETWMFPALLATRPDLARTVVDYRFRTRGAAARNAAELGLRGLFYPWTSGSAGDLWTECQSWNPPHCVTQIHLQGDIALAVWQYWQATGDLAWLRGRGWPLLKGIAEFWTSRAVRNPDGSRSIKDVAGPDEYSNGVDDGVYTNAVAATALRHAASAARLLGEPAPAEWPALADRLRIPYDRARKVYLQYAGYSGSVIKQADAVLLIHPLRWPMPKGAAAATLDHYAERTDPDGPAMTDSVNAVAAASVGEPGCATHTYLQRAVRPFVRGPFALFSEARGAKAGAADPLAGSPAEDFLTGKGGLLQVFTQGLTGLRLREDGIALDPLLPPQLAPGVTLRALRYRGSAYAVEIGPRTTRVRLLSGRPFTVHTPRGPKELTGTLELPTRRPDLAPTANLARCRPARADSEQPGAYAEAAVDGSRATVWRPDAGGAGGTRAVRAAALTVALGRAVPVASVTPSWKGAAPAAYAVETSRDAAHWGPLRPGARVSHVRLRVSGPAGLRELTVRGVE